MRHHRSWITEGHYFSGASRVGVWRGPSSWLAGPHMMGRALASSSKDTNPILDPTPGPHLMLITS